mgnify:CR=1 FL=1
MNLQPRASHPVTRALLALLAALTLGVVAAQSNDITFAYEVLRVDLVRGDDGAPTEQLTPTEAAFPGEILEYRVTARNDGNLFYRPGRVVVQLPIGEGATYVPDSASTDPDLLVAELSVDGGETFVTIPADGQDASEAYAAIDPADATHLRWTFTILFEPDQEETLSYRVELQ